MIEYNKKFIGEKMKNILEIEKINSALYKIKEKNIFYPDGKGGQLGDRGKIGEANIIEVNEDYIKLDREIENGKYEYIIDFERRKDIMQQHTAQHIFSALAYNLYSYNTVGFRMGEEYTTVDLDSNKINQEVIDNLEKEVNKIIENNIAVTESIYSNQEAHKIENLRKKIKEKIEGDVRFIKIGDVDFCACAGFHVKNTNEILNFKIINYEIVKSNFTRFYFLAGKRAKEDYSKKHDIIKKLTQMFSCKVEDIIEMIDKSTEEKKEIINSLKEIENLYTENISKELEEKYLEENEYRFILYNKNKEIANLLPKYINLDDFLLISGFDKNYSLHSNKYDCKEIIKKILSIDSSVKGGGSSTKGNIKFLEKLSYDEIIEIIKKGLRYGK